ncbi:MAG: TRAP transporter small permease subunit [Myxococcales bacterium]
MLKRFNDGIAHGEATVAMWMLLLMLVMAFAQALMRNLANMGISWANAGLEWMDWADFILTKGTLWLAFLGASLGVHANKHVAIDIVPRFVSPFVRTIFQMLVGFIGSVICFYLARAFMDAVIINGEELTAAYETLTPEGAIHVCDASAQVLKDTQSVAGPYCIVRGIFSALGMKMETPGAAFQLIVPAMFSFMAVRMFAGGVLNAQRLARGEVDPGDPHEQGLQGNADAVAKDLNRDGKG